MEIEFNTGGPVGKPDPRQPAARQEPTPPVREDVSFQTDALEKQLRDVAPIRPERVERAKDQGDKRSGDTDSDFK